MLLILSTKTSPPRYRFDPCACKRGVSIACCAHPCHHLPVSGPTTAQGCSALPMRFAFFAFLLLAALAAPRSDAQEALVVGLAAPLSNDLAVLGRQWADGARVAANRDGSVRLVEADSGCTEDGGAAAARQLMEKGASIVIGFLCTPAIEATLPLFTEAGIPVITPVRTTGLTDHKTRTGWLVYRLGP